MHQGDHQHDRNRNRACASADRLQCVSALRLAMRNWTRVWSRSESWILTINCSRSAFVSAQVPSALWLERGVQATHVLRAPLTTRSVHCSDGWQTKPEPVSRTLSATGGDGWSKSSTRVRARPVGRLGASQRHGALVGAWRLRATDTRLESSESDSVLAPPSSVPLTASRELDTDDIDDEVEIPISSFTVDDFMAPKPQRIDRVLTDRFSEPSRTYFQYLVAQQAVRVNGQVARRKSQLVTQGDLIHVRFLLPAQRAARDLVPEDLPLEILYEDDDIMVLNKATDMVVHPAPGNWRGTLANALAFRFGTPTRTDAAAVEGAHSGGAYADDALRPGIVHRLDKGTSGVLVVAKNALAERRLQRAFALRQVYKEYLAVLAGTPRVLQNGPYLVELPIGRHPSRWLEHRILAETQGGRPARSHFETLAIRPSTAPLTLVRVRIETGRTHQIRVHARHGLHAPVLGDDLYGYSAWNQRYRTRARRPLLHAWRLGFRHPLTHAWCVFEAPPPEDFDYFIQLLNVRWAEVPSLAELRAREAADVNSCAPPDRI